MLEDATRLTLGVALRRIAAAQPNAPALLSDLRSLTWGELDAEVDRLGALLLDAGVQRADVVGFMLLKRPEVVIGFLACARIGAIMAPINFKLHPARVRDQLRSAQIETIFCEGAQRKLLDAVSDLLPDPGRVIWVGDGGPETATAYSDIEKLPDAPLWDTSAPDTPCYLNYTSGTTGRPKGAITTHRNIQENGVATIEGLGFTSDDVFLGMFSVFSHPHELFHRSLLVGGAFVILDSISPRVVAGCVARFGVTWMMAVPSFYEMMLDYAAPREDRRATSSSSSPGRAGGYDLSSLRMLESGGAYVSADMLERMEGLFDATFLPVWGCTEATGVALANGPRADTRRPGATGRPVPGYGVRVVDDSGTEVPPDTVGELVIQGPSVASGYWRQPEETARGFKDGWYHTGDLVTADTGGFITFQGRRSEMLKIGGIRVYPLEIERVLKAHPEVIDAVVVRAEERLRGEIARAVVATTPGSALNRRKVQAWCREQLAVYKVPRIVEFWREVPKLPNGKVDKVTVRSVTADPERDER